MNRAIALSALFLIGGLAGCIGDENQRQGVPVMAMDLPSEAIYEILAVEEEWITMTDGQRIHNAVYRPDTDEQVPVFINFSPYWGDTAELGGDAFSMYMINEYVPRGYAVVLTSLRGTGHSEGCFQIGGDLELQDMYDIIDFYANEDWSNGNIATGGKSYDSTPTNGLIAKFPHPALKGVFHVSGITDMYAYNYKGGVPYATGSVFNTYYYLQGTDEYGVSLVGAGSPADEDAESLVRVIDDAACTELPQMQVSGVGSGVHGLKDSYWIERDYARYIADSDWNGSIFFVHGLQDWNVKPDHILPWIDNLPEQIRVKGWLHQSGHVYPERDDWNTTMLAWMDTELKGHTTDFWSKQAWDSLGNDGQWRESDQWPVGTPFEWHVTNKVPSGNVALGASVSNELTLAFDADDAAAGNATGWQRITGSPRIEITATPLAPDAILTAVITVNGEWISEGVLRSIYRDGLDQPVAILPGVPDTFVLDAFPVDAILAPGSVIEITLGAVMTQSVANPVQIRLVDYGESTKLQVLMSSADTREGQPIDIGCFAC